MHQFIYNGRSSPDFNLFLSGEDTWTKALPDMERMRREQFKEHYQADPESMDFSLVDLAAVDLAVFFTANLVGKMASEGTTPRQLTDLIGSLCDLTSGSGDKGTPVVLVQGYFDNYTN